MENVKILSVKHNLNQVKENYKSDAVKKLEVRIKEKETNIKEMLNRLQVFATEEEMLNANSKLGTNEKGSRIAEIREAADYYRTRLNEIKLETLRLNDRIDSVKEEIQKVYLQINEATAKERKPSSYLLVVLECAQSMKKELSFSYYIQSAGWEPTYDFRVEDISKPLTIVYNANVYQTSGEDWKNVKVKLSANNPSLSGSKPDLNTWYVNRSNRHERKTAGEGTCSIRGNITDKESGEPLPFTTVQVMQSTETVGSAISDIDGNFVVKPLRTGSYQLKAFFVGYGPAEVKSIYLSPGETETIKISLTQGKIELAEVQVAASENIEAMQSMSERKVRMEDIKIKRDVEELLSVSPGASSGYIYGESGNSIFERTAPRVSLSSADYNEDSFNTDTYLNTATVSNFISHSLKTNVTNIEYDIEIPYSVYSDGINYSIKIKEAAVPVTYHFYVVPKIDYDAFLTAEIVNWNELNLLSGKAGIYYQGTFTGETSLDVNIASDTMQISLGRDKNITVKRESRKELNDKRASGNSVKEMVGWEITVRNNKNSAVKLTVEDQYPLSEVKSMDAELLEALNATVNSKTGKLTWDLSLEPGEKKVLNYKYSVKYPKYAALYLE
jgi:hypothetical protein